MNDRKNLSFNGTFLVCRFACCWKHSFSVVVSFQFCSVCTVHLLNRGVESTIERALNVFFSSSSLVPKCCVPSVLCVHLLLVPLPANDNVIFNSFLVFDSFRSFWYREHTYRIFSDSLFLRCCCRHVFFLFFPFWFFALFLSHSFRYLLFRISIYVASSSHSCFVYSQWWWISSLPKFSDFDFASTTFISLSLYGRCYTYRVRAQVKVCKCVCVLMNASKRRYIKLFL